MHKPLIYISFRFDDTDLSGCYNWRAILNYASCRKKSSLQATGTSCYCHVSRPVSWYEAQMFGL